MTPHWSKIFKTDPATWPPSKPLTKKQIKRFKKAMEKIAADYERNKRHQIEMAHRAHEFVITI